MENRNRILVSAKRRKKVAMAVATAVASPAAMSAIYVAPADIDNYKKKTDQSFFDLYQNSENAIGQGINPVVRDLSSNMKTNNRMFEGNTIDRVATGSLSGLSMGGGREGYLALIPKDHEGRTPNLINGKGQRVPANNGQIIYRVRVKEANDYVLKNPHFFPEEIRLREAKNAGKILIDGYGATAAGIVNVSDINALQIRSSNNKCAKYYSTKYGRACQVYQREAFEYQINPMASMVTHGNTLQKQYHKIIDRGKYGVRDGGIAKNWRTEQVLTIRTTPVNFAALIDKGFQKITIKQKDTIKNLIKEEYMRGSSYRVSTGDDANETLRGSKRRKFFWR